MQALEFIYKVTGKGETPEECFTNAVETLRAALQRWELQPRDSQGYLKDPPMLAAVNVLDNVAASPAYQMGLESIDGEETRSITT